MRYPLTISPEGSLALDASDLDVRRSRARLLLACRKGDRALLPEFGSAVDQFAPWDGSELEAELLRLELERWCGTGYVVTSAMATNGRITFKVQV